MPIIILFSAGNQKNQDGHQISKHDKKKHSSSMSVLQRLMSPVVNIKKLPSNITPNVVVMVSDDETEMSDTPESGRFTAKKSQYSLSEKEEIAREAKRFGTTHVSRTRSIPLADILTWMAIFGLRHSQKSNKQVDHEADLSIVRWVIQQQQLKGQVDVNSMKTCAWNVYRHTNPNFTATKTWLISFLKRNMSVLQGTQFVSVNQIDVAPSINEDSNSSAVKQEILSIEDLVNDNETQLEESSLKDNDEMMLDEEGFDDFDEMGEEGNDDFTSVFERRESSSEQSLPVNRTQGSVITPFGKRPIIIGQSKSFDAKSERKIVQWVLERNARDGYVFTDDFKDFARSLYKGSKPFAATQAWMKKFLRRNRALKNIRFCSKYKNVYTNEEKVSAVAMARRFGVTYASNHTGINPKIIHSWKLAVDRGQLILPSPTTPDMSLDLDKALPSVKTTVQSDSNDSPCTTTKPSSTSHEATHGIVPEFEQRIISMMRDFQLKEGSINYNDISRISQSVYKETRPLFKASYSWIRVFLERHKEELKDIELENVSKVLFDESQNVGSSTTKFGNVLSRETISEMVDSALEQIDFSDHTGSIQQSEKSKKPISSKKPIVVGPSVSFNRKTEKQMVEWALERQNQDGYVFTDDFKEFAKSLHTGPKHFSASSGWMSLFLRRHRVLKDVQWKSKFKNNYTDEEKKMAVAEAKRLGTGHVGRKLGIDPALICAWRIKMEKAAHKHTFWKGIKIKFGKGPKPIQTKFSPIKLGRDNDAARGIVPEFEERIVELILQEHTREGSISYEEISRISQDVYKETRSNFKASYAWIRNFMKRHENELGELNIDNVKKVFIPDTEEADLLPRQPISKRPIIIGQSRSLDIKAEKKLVEWMVAQQAKDGYVFLDQFKKYAQSLYKGSKKFAATQAWRIKFLRRHHNAVKHVKITSSFRNQYDPEEKRVIVEEARKYGTTHVAKKTGIDPCLINSWRLKMEKSGEISSDTSEKTVMQSLSISSQRKTGNVAKFASHLKKIESDVGPGLYSSRGIVPQYERKIVELINEKMDEEGSVSYQDVSNIARAIYKETRPSFKACYNWIKEFIKRHKKGLQHVDFENTKKLVFEGEDGTEVLIPEDKMEDINSFVAATLNPQETLESRDEVQEQIPNVSDDPMIVIDNAEDPNYDDHSGFTGPMMSTPKISSTSLDIEKIKSKKPLVVGMPVHFTRKTEKKLVEWLLERQTRDEFVFTDDFREYARSLYNGPPGKFAATNAWISKFLKRNRLQKKIKFESRLKGNNPKYEEKIIELILEQQRNEGSVSNDDIQKITTDVYKDIRPNFRACYNWIRDFIKRHKEELAEVELENVKKVYIPDDEGDGVITQDYDPAKSFYGKEGLLDNMETSCDSSWTDMESSSSFDRSRSHTPQKQTSISALDKLASQKRPVIIAPPKSLDVKTEKKLVQWMQKEQQKNGCVYLDLFKQYAKSIHSGPKHFAATQAWMIRFKQRNHEALKNVKICSRFRKEYSVEEKMAAVEEARRLGCNHVGRKLGINGGVIYSWKVQLEQAEKLGANSSFGRGVTDSEERESFRGQVPEFEEAIVEQVLELQKSKGSVTYDDISRISRIVYKETRPNFKASYNWVLDFIRRYKDKLESVKIENQKKVLSEEEKLQILSEEKKYGTDHVVRKRNISASTIYNWKRSMKAKSIPIPKFKALVGSKIKKKYAKGKKGLRNYTLEEKRKAVAVAEANGITYAHLKLGIPRNNISKWIKYFRDQGENIVINFTHSATLKKELLQKVAEWVLQQNDDIGIVLTDRIQEFAQKLFEENYTNFQASRNWLESFITKHSEKFQHVRFRERGDKDLDFTNDVKLKISRYAEKHGAVATAEIAGVTPNNVYHWRRMMRHKGHDLVPGSEAISSTSTGESKSQLQQKLDTIAQRFSMEERKFIVAEANSDGTSSTASKHKIPLPLLLKWMKLYQDETDVKQETGVLGKDKPSTESTPEVKSLEMLKVCLPSVERAKASTAGQTRYPYSFKKQIIEQAREIGIPETGRRNGLPTSTLYNWWKEIERESPCRSNRKSVEKSRKSLEPIQSETSISKGERKTPIRIKTEPEDSFDVEGTPSTSFTDSGSERTPQGLYSSLKLPRKYSEEEKLYAIQTALKIGAKPASIELDIPLSNVRRWTNMYQKKMKESENDQSKDITLETESRNQISDNPDTSCTVTHTNVEDDHPVDLNHTNEEPEEHVALSRILTQGLQSQKTKRKYFENSNESDLAKKRKISASYTDEEKTAFVQQSIENSSRYAAEKANVSLDVMYKWRQKFLSGAHIASQGPSATTSNTTDEVVQANEPMLERERDVGETLIEASDIPDISVPPFSTENDLFDMSGDYLNTNDTLDKGDNVIFPEVQELNLDKSEDYPHLPIAAKQSGENCNETTNFDLIKIEDVKSESSSQ